MWLKKRAMLTLGILFSATAITIALNSRNDRLAAGKFEESNAVEEDYGEHTYEVKLPDGTSERWSDEPYETPEISGVVKHYRTFTEDGDNIKAFMTKDGHPFYYNSTHNFYTALPEGIGYYQAGEPVLGGHYNEFYNADTTLIITAGGLYYDALLDDYPDYADTLRKLETEKLRELGQHTLRRISPSQWVSEGRIDRSNPDNPAPDRFIRKWMLLNNSSGRESEVTLTIYYRDSLSDRLPEFRDIIDRFPAPPSFNHGK